MLENITSKNEFEKLGKEIDTVIMQLNGMNPTSDEYKAIVKNLGSLTDIQSKMAEIQCKVADAQCKEKIAKEKNSVSPDTIAVIAGNLLGIGLILGFEKANVITSKALGFVLRGRV